MIRYPISKSALSKLITAESADWLARAKARTDQFRQQGNFEETTSIWSEVKPVYMRLQGESKCSYCERKLEAVDLGKGEQDVEHFRPKSNVGQWNVPPSLVAPTIAFTAPPAEKKGYFLLPYNIFNYSAACKPCNSALKSDYFPIAGDYDFVGEDPKKLAKEKPYLIYPIGSIDSKPEDLIQFHGVSPQPVVASGHDRNRALVTIEFFKLDDLKRKNLTRERAIVIIAMQPQLEKLKSTVAAEKSQAKKLVDGFMSLKSSHTNCARSFKRLFDIDPVEAKSVFDKAVEFMISTS